MNSTSAWLCLNYYIFHTIFKLVGTRLTGHIRRLHTNKTNLGMIARGRKWLYFKQWKQTFPFTLKSAFPWLNHASAFSWQQRLATLTLTPSFQRDHQLVELLHALGQTSLIQSEPVLANPSKGHHSSVTTKAAHSLQWRERRVWQKRPGWPSEGEGVFIAICTIRQKKLEKLLRVMFSREGVWKHEMLTTLLKCMIQLTSTVKGRICSLIWADKSTAMRFIS